MRSNRAVLLGALAALLAPAAAQAQDAREPVERDDRPERDHADHPRDTDWRESAIKSERESAPKDPDEKTKPYDPDRTWGYVHPAGNAMSAFDTVSMVLPKTLVITGASRFYFAPFEQLDTSPGGIARFTANQDYGPRQANEELLVRPGRKYAVVFFCGANPVVRFVSISQTGDKQTEILKCN